MSQPPMPGQPDQPGQPDYPGPPGDWPDPTAPSPSGEPPTISAATPAVPGVPAGPGVPGSPGGPGAPPAGPTAPAYPQSAYGPPPAAPPGYGYQPQYAYPPPATTNGMAIASLVCSLAGLAVGISAPVGAILGHVARRQIRERGEQGDGMALAGIIVGWVITGLMVLCCGGYIAIIGFAINQDSNSF